MLRIFILITLLAVACAEPYAWAVVEDATCNLDVPVNTPFNMNTSQTFIGYGDLYYPYPQVAATVPQYWVFDAERGYQYWQLSVGEYLVTPTTMYVKEPSAGFDLARIRANYTSQIRTYSFLPKLGRAVDPQYGLVDIYGGGSNSDNAACGLLQPATIFVKPCSNRIVMLAETTIRPLPGGLKGAVGARFYAVESIVGAADQAKFNVTAFTGGMRHRDMADYCRVIYQLDTARWRDYLTLPDYVWPLADNCHRPADC